MKTYSKVFFGWKPDSTRILKASRMVTDPVPLSSAPGERPAEVLPTESWCAPTMTRLVVFPGILAIMDGWLNECVNLVTVIAGLAAAIAVT